MYNMINVINNALGDGQMASPTPRIHPNPGPLSQWCISLTNLYFLCYLAYSGVFQSKGKQFDIIEPVKYNVEFYFSYISWEKKSNLNFQKMVTT